MASELPFKGKPHACVHVPPAWVGRPNAWAHASIMWARTEREARDYAGPDKYNPGAVREYLGKFASSAEAEAEMRRRLTEKYGR